MYEFILYHDSMARVKNDRTLKTLKDVKKLVEKPSNIHDFFKMWKLRSIDRN